MQSASLAATFPVFVFPNTVNFYLENQETHKQVLTIYNVYDCAVRFKVLCTAPDKYNVVDPEGSINPHCSLDIVIRHKAVKPANCNVIDKFRVQLLEYSSKKILGKKDIIATLNAKLPDADETTDECKPSVKSCDDIKSSFREGSSRDLAGKGKNGPHSLIVLAGLICIVGLLMPNEGEQSSWAIQCSCHMKLVFAYVLGLVTMAILQL